MQIKDTLLHSSSVMHTLIFLAQCTHILIEYAAPNPHRAVERPGPTK